MSWIIKNRIQPPKSKSQIVEIECSRCRYRETKSLAVPLPSTCYLCGQDNSEVIL